MASEVEICSNALRKLGDKPITALTDDSDRARLCNALYGDTRDAVLRAHPWNCALMRVALNKLPLETPVFGYANAFQLPTDPYCLRVLSIDDDTARWKIEGRRLLTDLAKVSISYIAQITDVNAFDTLLKDAIGARLAAEMAYPITGGKTNADAFWTLYREKIREARGVDGQEGTTDDLVSDDLTIVR
jgi:hypothetical protein